MVKMMTMCMNAPTKNILPAPNTSSMALPPNPTTALATPATTKNIEGDFIANQPPPLLTGRMNMSCSVARRNLTAHHITELCPSLREW